MVHFSRITLKLSINKITHTLAHGILTQRTSAVYVERRGECPPNGIATMHKVLHCNVLRLVVAHVVTATWQEAAANVIQV